MSGSFLIDTFIEHGCLPHQAEFSASFFAPDAPRKHLLVGAPGTGKGFTAAAIINHAISTGQAHRVLLLAPSALLDQWQSSIQRDDPAAPTIIIFNRRRIRELESETPVGEEIWPLSAIVIMSIDVAKQSDVAAAITRSSWDFLVVDEVHLATPRSLRAKLLVDLIGRFPKMRALLLQPGGLFTNLKFDISPDIVRDVTLVQWLGKTLRDHNGKPLLPEVQIEWIRYRRRPDEIELLAQLEDLLRSLDVKERKPRHAIVRLLESASSSLFALEQRLRRTRQRRKELLHGLGEGAHDEVEDMHEDEFEIHSSAEWPIYGEIAKIADQLLPLLEEEGSDSKLDALLKVLRSFGVMDAPNGLHFIFTSYPDTASYLESALRELYPLVRVLSEDFSPSTSKESATSQANNDNVVIATDSVATTVPENAKIIFYDLPLNPMALEQRIGRFARIGRQGPIRVLAFEDESDALYIERLQRNVIQKNNQNITNYSDDDFEQEINNLLFPSKNS